MQTVTPAELQALIEWAEAKIAEGEMVALYRANLAALLELEERRRADGG